jgi:hypothetical protein
MSRLNWKRILLLLAGLFILGRYILPNLLVSEEQRILAVVDQAQESVESKSLFRFQQVLSPRYKDRSGLDRSSLLRLAGAYFQGQDHVEIVRMSSEVEIESEDKAVTEIRVQVFGLSEAGWSRGLSDSSMLGEKYTIQLRKESGSWRITAVDPESRDWPNRF